MTIRIPTLVAAGVLALGLAACGNGSSNNASPAPAPAPPPPPAPIEAQFGSCFATRYEAGPFTKATDPVPCPDLAPLSLTTQPAKL